MFRITSSKGFHIEFSNGVTVSVQFGGGNYCDNYDIKIGSERELNKLCSDNAEVGIWDENNKWITKEYNRKENDDVIGYQDVTDVLKILNWAASYAKSERKE